MTHAYGPGIAAFLEALEADHHLPSEIVITLLCTCDVDDLDPTCINGIGTFFQIVRQIVDAANGFQCVVEIDVGRVGRRKQFFDAIRGEAREKCFEIFYRRCLVCGTRCGRRRVGDANGFKCGKCFHAFTRTQFK